MKEENENIEELNEKELLKLIYKEVMKNIKELNEKIKHLDEKIDNTKNQLVAEIAEELNNFSIMTAKSINNLENKIENEIEDRKVEFRKVKDFNKIIITDIRSRVSILEEENEKYNLK